MKAVATMTRLRLSVPASLLAALVLGCSGDDKFGSNTGADEPGPFTPEPQAGSGEPEDGTVPAEVAPMTSSSDDGPLLPTAAPQPTPSASDAVEDSPVEGSQAPEVTQPPAEDSIEASCEDPLNSDEGEPEPPSPAEPSVPEGSDEVTPEPAVEPAPSSPPPGDYETRAELPEANSEMAVAELDGKIYVVGGYPSSRETQDTVQVYDTTADAWSRAQSLPEPIHHPVLLSAEGLLYSLGGQPDTSRSLAYDPGTDTWSDIAPMPTARGGGAGAVIDGRLYVVGGRPPAANAFEVYTIGSDSWEELEPLPKDYDDRNHLAAAAIDGKVYVAGGRYDGAGFSSPMTDVLDVFDPETGEWTRAASMLRPRGGVNGVVAHGCFYVFGGEGTNTGEPNDVFPDHDVYDPTTDTWESLAPLPTPVHGVTGAAFVGGLIYMPGGGTSSGGSSGSTLLQVFHPEKRCDGT